MGRLVVEDSAYTSVRCPGRKFAVTDQQFKIVYAGRLAEGASQPDVAVALARLFKTEVAKIAPMFSGQQVVLRKGLDAVMAAQYLTVLAKAGALAEQVPMAGEAPASPVPAASALDVVPAALARPAPAIARAAETPPEAPDFGLAAAGTLLVEAMDTPAPAIDISTLTMAAAGVLLVDAVEVPEPHYQLDGLKLDPPGSTLDDTPPSPPRDFDLSGLSLAE